MKSEFSWSNRRLNDLIKAEKKEFFKNIFLILATLCRAPTEIFDKCSLELVDIRCQTLSVTKIFYDITRKADHKYEYGFPHLPQCT